MKVEKAKLIIKARSKEMAEISAINSFGHIPVQQAIPISDVIKILDQLDQPKPVVPQFVAEWYEKHKHAFMYFYVRLIVDFYKKRTNEYNQAFIDWVRKTNEAYTILTNMHQFGYTVEKEKLYTVEIPNPNEGQLSFVLMRQPGGNVRIKVMHSSNLDLLKTDNDLQLTEAEIRKDFDWAWQQGFAKEVTE